MLKSEENKPTKSLPVLPLKDVVIFPGMTIPVDVGRKKSLAAIEKATSGKREILLVAQKSQDTEDVKANDIYHFGCVCHIAQLLRLPGGTSRALVEGKERVKLKNIRVGSQCIEAEYEKASFKDIHTDDKSITPKKLANVKAMRKAVFDQFERYAGTNLKRGEDFSQDPSEITSTSNLADQIAIRISCEVAKKQKVLETLDPMKRMELLFNILEQEISVLKMETKIRSRVKGQMEKTQREYYLNEQMKAIQRELGEGESGENEIVELKKAVDKAKLPKEAAAKANAEIKRLSTMSPMSAEATVVRNYLDWILGIPWTKKSKEHHNLNIANKILDEQHYGLDKVKERILEYLAVQARQKNVKGAKSGSLLCLVGPPGVGKTSLGRSIAEATGREFIRMSLGGMRDEAEIRGHRRTYIGAMPGKIIQGMKRAGTVNPLFLLDEIDKLGYDWRGDPSSALLEVLDPEQNSTFNDHYMEVDYDLSKVMFITTANTIDMPAPLLDRLEIIRLAGYTEEEKTQIAFRHLIPKLRKDNGLKDKEWVISAKAMVKLIQEYTREAGVRNLEREIAGLMRKAVKKLVEGADKKSQAAKNKASASSIKVTASNILKWAGVRKFSYHSQEKENMIGVVTGLAWTGVGGELLTIEAVRIPGGSGRVTHTGKLGDVMKESIQASENYVKSRAQQLGVTPNRFAKTNVHVHVPEGATPKDGPSAGVAMITSIISVLTDNPIRYDVAMTGEITLRGRVLPIGGLKEKLLAALRGNIRAVIIPKDNLHQLAEIQPNIKDALEIIPAENVEDVLKAALVNPLTPCNWSDEDEKFIAQATKGEGQHQSPLNA